MYGILDTQKAYTCYDWPAESWIFIWMWVLTQVLHGSSEMIEINHWMIGRKMSTFVFVRDKMNQLWQLEPCGFNLFWTFLTSRKLNQKKSLRSRGALTWLVLSGSIGWVAPKHHPKLPTRKDTPILRREVWADMKFFGLLGDNLRKWKKGKFSRCGIFGIICLQWAFLVP